MVRGIANSKIGFGDLILLLRYFFKLKVSTHPSVTVIVFAFHDLFYDGLGQLVTKGKPLFERPAAVQIADPVPQLDVEKILLQV